MSRRREAEGYLLASQLLVMEVKATLGRGHDEVPMLEVLEGCIENMRLRIIGRPQPHHYLDREADPHFIADLRRWQRAIEADPLHRRET